MEEERGDECSAATPLNLSGRARLRQPPAPWPASCRESFLKDVPLNTVCVT